MSKEMPDELAEKILVNNDEYRDALWSRGDVIDRAQQLVHERRGDGVEERLEQYNSGPDWDYLESICRGGSIDNQYRGELLVGGVFAATSRREDYSEELWDDVMAWGDAKKQALLETVKQEQDESVFSPAEFAVLICCPKLREKHWGKMDMDISVGNLSGKFGRVREKLRAAESSVGTAETAGFDY